MYRAIRMSILIISFSDQLHHVDQFNDMTAIPCEYCGKSFEWRHFEEHVVGAIINFYLYYSFIYQHTCATQYYERRQDQSRLLH
jgi:hypothetical protein